MNIGLKSSSVQVGTDNHSVWRLECITNSSHDGTHIYNTYILKVRQNDQLVVAHHLLNRMIPCM